MTSTPLHHVNPNGKVTLAPQTLHLDRHEKIYRRRRTFRERVWDVFPWVLPALTLALVVVCWLVIFNVGAAVLRAIGR